ncbi:hypothetical protein [Alicyclobacillus kakegawensis]|uniref:hypothetical protein n=1 Tax=Alicyclobacillus kakegawensis TaxID=392012 RepID=UPI000836ED96|nr:hypothetical protein [Alicyclobacillus kakegawensis]
MNLWGWGLVAFVLWTLLVFAVARRSGRREGRREAEAALPLALRRTALARGRCPVCDHRCDTIEKE